MTTSGVYTFSVNRDQIIRMALLILDKLEESEVPTAQEVTDCSTILNMMVKQWQGKSDFAPGLKTWTRRHGHLFLSNSTGQYTVGPAGTGWTNSYVAPTLTAAASAGASAVVVSSATGIAASSNIGIVLSNGSLFWTTVSSVVGTTVNLNATLTAAAASGAQVFSYTTTAQQPVVIESAFLRDIFNQDTPLNIFNSVQDYDMLPSKTDTTFTADPISIYYEFQLGNSVLYTDCAAAQDVTKHICLTYLEAVQDFTTSNDTPSYPQEWHLALSYGLAKLIAPIFAVSWTPVQEANYVSALMMAQNKEPENTSMYFQCKGADI